MLLDSVFLSTVKMNKLNKPQEFDSYELEELSDEERAESRWDISLRVPGGATWSTWKHMLGFCCCVVVVFAFTEPMFSVL